MLACLKSQRQCVQLLLTNGADPLKLNNLNESAKDCVPPSKHARSILKMLGALVEGEEEVRVGGEEEKHDIREAKIRGIEEEEEREEEADVEHDSIRKAESKC